MSTLATELKSRNKTRTISIQGSATKPKIRQNIDTGKGPAKVFHLI